MSALTQLVEIRERLVGKVVAPPNASALDLVEILLAAYEETDGKDWWAEDFAVRVTPESELPPVGTKLHGSYHVVRSGGPNDPFREKPCVRIDAPLDPGTEVVSRSVELGQDEMEADRDLYERLAEDRAREIDHLAKFLQRPWTPATLTTMDDGGLGTRMVVKQTCPDCGLRIGDVTPEEIGAYIEGGPAAEQAADAARADCPNCYRAHLEEELGGDLSHCPYYQRDLGGDPAGICSMGCQDEPACQTSEPSEGWPLARAQHRARASLFTDRQMELLRLAVKLLRAGGELLADPEKIEELDRLEQRLFLVKRDWPPFERSAFELQPEDPGENVEPGDEWMQRAAMLADIDAADEDD